MTLGLGTVQFGMNYGISNKDGMPSIESIRGILEAFKKSGNRVLDTAAVYGSESVLGELGCAAAGFKIVTKTCKTKTSAWNDESIALLEGGLRQSLRNLKARKIYGLLVHDANDLRIASAPRLVKTLEAFKRHGLVEKIGVSVYNTQDLSDALRLFTPDIVQLPVNTLDQRLIENGKLAELKSLGVEIHARSVFLQGALLMPIQSIPEKIKALRPYLQAIHDETAKLGISALEHALGFIKGVREVDCALIGVNSQEELEAVLSAWSQTPTNIDYSKYSCKEEKLINPSIW